MVCTQSRLMGEENDGWELAYLVSYILDLKCQWESMWKCTEISWEFMRKFRTRDTDLLP